MNLSSNLDHRCMTKRKRECWFQENFELISFVELRLDNKEKGIFFSIFRQAQKWFAESSRDNINSYYFRVIAKVQGDNYSLNICIQC